MHIIGDEKYRPEITLTTIGKSDLGLNFGHEFNSRPYSTYSVAQMEIIIHSSHQSIGSHVVSGNLTPFIQHNRK